MKTEKDQKPECCEDDRSNARSMRRLSDPGDELRNAYTHAERGRVFQYPPLFCTVHKSIFDVL